MSKYLINVDAEFPTPQSASPRPGWNVRCNMCGSFGAKWTDSSRDRPHWGSLCLCPKHYDEFVEMKRRHREELSRFQCAKYEQLHGEKLRYALSKVDE